ncbi:(4Fe-4S)-binding protein [Fulvivirga sedimenti]|jgi:uncharacterized Fe-S cluster protein YjdI/CDGSH-type Zn-finger protein|uniref:(4Fe-4S)-binding protein n=1 Tax=Fulvivirga sedimenti TaxID=2879465 RepID=A0A9X1KYH1_9BACT|nr:(4Fe-4S)-binding protein [Fulvivirga sedimenti]MCA6073606.1 (4Fe-4S)-binding protein [Fulvivirga sedimenti]
MKEITKKYSEGDLTVIWQPHKCIHSEKCMRGLPSVFQPDNKPWINPAGASADAVRKQIDKCPSGALSYEGQHTTSSNESSLRVEVRKNGPLLIHSKMILESDGVEKPIDAAATAFCRCGASSNKPFCDGSHKKINFEG